MLQRPPSAAPPALSAGRRHGRAAGAGGSARHPAGRGGHHHPHRLRAGARPRAEAGGIWVLIGFRDLGDVSGIHILFLATLVIGWAPRIIVGFRIVGGLQGSCDCVGFGDFSCTTGFGVGLGILMVLWWAAL